MPYKTLLYEVTDEIAVLTLNRPEHRNALSIELRAEFSDVILKIRNDKGIKAVILTGTGSAFCAGGDIGEMEKFKKNTPTENRQTLRDVHAWLPEYTNLEKPVIAAVNGDAYGAGFNMALAADFIVCTPSARFCQVFARVGLVPDFAGLYLLPRIVGLQKAKEIMYSARVVAAEEAKALGIVYAVHPAEQLMDAARELAGRFRLAPTEVIGITKNLLNQSFQSDQRIMGELESFASMTARTLPYHLEAIGRFRAKQIPLYDWDAMDRQTAQSAAEVRPVGRP